MTIMPSHPEMLSLFLTKAADFQIKRPHVVYCDLFIVVASSQLHISVALIPQWCLGSQSLLLYSVSVVVAVKHTTCAQSHHNVTTRGCSTSLGFIDINHIITTFMFCNVVCLAAHFKQQRLYVFLTTPMGYNTQNCLFGSSTTQFKVTLLANLSYTTISKFIQKLPM